MEKLGIKRELKINKLPNMSKKSKFFRGLENKYIINLKIIFHCLHESFRLFRRQFNNNSCIFLKSTVTGCVLVINRNEWV